MTHRTLRALIFGTILVGALAATALAIEAWTVAAQSDQEVCEFIQEELSVQETVKATLCQDYQAGITRGHIRPERALQFLEAVGARITPETQGAAESLLLLTGQLLSPAKGDLPAELVIRRTFEILSKEQADEAMTVAVGEGAALGRVLQNVAAFYRSLNINLEPNVSKKVIQTEFGEVELTVGRVDTVITATSIALDRFERRLNRRLDDFEGMKTEVMKELSAPSGAEELPDSLIRQIDARTTGQEWAPIVRQLATDRGRNS